MERPVSEQRGGGCAPARGTEQVCGDAVSGLMIHRFAPRLPVPASLFLVAPAKG